MSSLSRPRSAAQGEISDQPSSERLAITNGVSLIRLDQYNFLSNQTLVIPYSITSKQFYLMQTSLQLTGAPEKVVQFTCSYS